MDIKEAVSQTLELPIDTVLDLPKVVITGCSKVYVENYKSLLEYKKENIKLKYKTGIIEISGSGFEIEKISESCILIGGKIGGVRFV